jgi:hypothetical protein
VTAKPSEENTTLQVALALVRALNATAVVDRRAALLDDEPLALAGAAPLLVPREPPSGGAAPGDAPPPR